jgi:hypothetical protein
MKNMIMYTPTKIFSVRFSTGLKIKKSIKKLKRI